MKKQENFIISILKDAKGIIKISQGLSNDNYLVTSKYNEKFVVRIANRSNQTLFNRDDEYQITKQIAPYFIDVPLVHYDKVSGDKVTLYQEGFKHLDTYQEDDVIKVAKIIKKLHSIPVNIKTIFNPIIKYQDYLSKIKDLPFEINNYHKLISLFSEYDNNSKKILCHNDIVKGNLLFNDNQVYLIDYEFAALNNPIFDLASFISENNIEDEKLQLTFLSTYFEDKLSNDIVHQFKVYHCFEDLLWSVWAYMRLLQTNDQVFQTIYSQKFARLNHNIVNL
jgi:thiamine kinase-like enzyme